MHGLKGALLQGCLERRPVHATLRAAKARLHPDLSTECPGRSLHSRHAHRQSLALRAQVYLRCPESTSDMRPNTPKGSRYRGRDEELSRGWGGALGDWGASAGAARTGTDGRGGRSAGSSSCDALGESSCPAHHMRPYQGRGGEGLQSAMHMLSKQSLASSYSW